MPNASARPRWNPWIALGGAAVLVALAVGLLAGGGANAASETTFGQYGDPNEPAPITNLSYKPTRPVKGKGFKVTFSVAGQVTYRLYAEDLIGNRWILDRGTANGTKTTATIGKRLKAGQFDLVAGRLYPGARNRFGKEIWYDELYTPLVVRRR